MAQGADIDGGTQRTEVVVVAHALELTRLSVELEAVLGRKTDTAYAEAGVDFVNNV